MEIAESKFIKITWGALGAATLTLVGFIFWLTALHGIANANAEKLEYRTGVFVDINRNLSNIDKRLSKIEGYLEAKKEKKQ